ncbi:hypothetical protein EV184_13440 [Sinorhizobium americanum]|uniref:Uncharacterized protein n=1 Tax=Sinorhizobium americanum TaxID=194963 RepID=A0A4R2AWL1_9HYPH|nr:hypothetical protein EV184_13440 [Sinorhizobium americanum]
MDHFPPEIHHFRLPRHADQLSDGGGGTRSLRQSNWGAEDAANPRFRRFEMAAASILKPAGSPGSSLINLTARDAGCSSMPDGRHTAPIEVCYEVTAGTACQRQMRFDHGRFQHAEAEVLIDADLRIEEPLHLAAAVTAPSAPCDRRRRRGSAEKQSLAEPERKHPRWCFLRRRTGGTGILGSAGQR